MQKEICLSSTVSLGGSARLSPLLQKVSSMHCTILCKIFKILNFLKSSEKCRNAALPLLPQLPVPTLSRVSSDDAQSAYFSRFDIQTKFHVDIIILY